MRIKSFKMSSDVDILDNTYYGISKIAVRSVLMPECRLKDDWGGRTDVLGSMSKVCCTLSYTNFLLEEAPN